MQLIWRKAESLNLPLEVDCTLSATDVYYRRNIEEKEFDNNGEKIKKYVYEETILPKEFRFPILDIEEYKTAIQNKINKINGKLHITKLDFFNNFCKPAGITYPTLMNTIIELNMQEDWELCNHVYYGVIKPFLNVLPLGKTEDEIIEIFENLQQND